MRRRMTANVPSIAGQKVPVVRGKTLRLVLLACGIASALLYAAMLVIVPMFWAGYSSASQTVSELSALDAPSARLWTTLGIIWSLLYAAFGFGVRLSAESNRALRVVGTAIVVSAIVGVFWPPMHRREVLAAGGGTLTDTLHIVWTIMNGVFTLVAMAFGAAGSRERFRRFSIASILVVLVAGLITSVDSPGVSMNLATPWIGVWERINIGVWLLWVLVLAVVLLPRAARR